MHVQEQQQQGQSSIMTQLQDLMGTGIENVVPCSSQPDAISCVPSDAHHMLCTIPAPHLTAGPTVAIAHVGLLQLWYLKHSTAQHSMQLVDTLGGTSHPQITPDLNLSAPHPLSSTSTLHTPRRTGHFIASADKAKRELGWQPRHDFLADVSSMVREYTASGRQNKDIDFSIDDKILAAVRQPARSRW
jgi:hypothetical protein